MQRFELDGKEYEATSPDFLALLPAAHQAKQRPLCLCQHPGPGIPMYLARFDERFLVKRMPGTGTQHTVNCDAFEAPADLTGLGELEGHAIVEDVDTGQVTLRLGYALAKGTSRQMPEPSGKEADSIHADPKKLSLRGTLHYLYEQAGLNRWSPAMAGKRNWYVVRKYLLQAAADKQAKRMNLLDLLYIPERFVSEQKAQIEQRRVAHLARISRSASGKPHYVLVIGEIKEIVAARDRKFKLVIKHLPNYDLMLESKTHERLRDRFAAEFELWSSVEGAQLMVIATVSLSATGTATVQECSVMLTSRQWIPFEHRHDAALLAALAERRYQKCLRYNQASSRPIASVLLTDTAKATALYVVPPEADDAFRTDLAAQVKESELDTWVWDPRAQTMPPLPEADANWARMKSPPKPTSARRGPTHASPSAADYHDPIPLDALPFDTVPPYDTPFDSMPPDDIHRAPQPTSLRDWQPDPSPGPNDGSDLDDPDSPGNWL
ncbi:DUF1173 domain-containing protein [Burkholderia glumae]|uniref:DUF1173 domain-containing protein n=1 Tax=Burkholderia glumae TaxID=337 RepID=UPI000417FAB0|nr:DUF1173 domain-containing protein [Burkholderia glumae]QKM57636.1 hypothetical protein CG017_05715 [Burkholderia glumae]